MRRLVENLGLRLPARFANMAITTPPDKEHVPPKVEPIELPYEEDVHGTSVAFHLSPVTMSRMINWEPSIALGRIFSYVHYSSRDNTYIQNFSFLAASKTDSLKVHKFFDVYERSLEDITRANKDSWVIRKEIPERKGCKLTEGGIIIDQQTGDTCIVYQTQDPYLTDAIEEQITSWAIDVRKMEEEKTDGFPTSVYYTQLTDGSFVADYVVHNLHLYTTIPAIYSETLREAFLDQEKPNDGGFGFPGVRLSRMQRSHAAFLERNGLLDLSEVVPGTMGTS